MEAEFPLSVREAEEHIAQIRRDKGLGEGPDQIGNNAADLESALELLSDDLYQTSTHFLLELIQNADDNSYDNDTPTLCISYSSGRVRVDCNERGFSKKNIEAICRICHSTKSGRSKSAGFVGEKGIGFKAVFKVASKVWISSGHYSFRFDRDAHLGMIAPIWDEFPEPKREGYTSIFLKLARDCDEKRIQRELASYDQKMLLFLRRLRRLEIDVKPGVLSFPFSAAVKTVLSSHGHAAENPSNVVLMKNGVKKHYFVWRHTAKKLPTETRRPNISSSEIVLAFPNTGSDGGLAVSPIVESQHVYAFLPIRDGGLPFLLQADFLLPASREDIHDDSPWNMALSKAAAIAYMAAVAHMSNLTNELRYHWVQYVPTTVAKTTFLEGLRKDVVAKLVKAKILDSHTGRKKKPAKLIMVPPEWRDPSGKPFMIRKWNRDNFLASGYDDKIDWVYTRYLGVRLMDKNTFYDQMLKTVKKNPGAFFSDKSLDWHSSFARALVDMNVAHLTMTIPLIPLQNGKWVSTHNVGPVYFWNKKSMAAVPKGIEIQIVDPSASTNPDRMKLFAHVGVQHLDDQKIREAVLAAHRSEDGSFKPDNLTPEDLVSHLEFLFKTKPKEKAAAVVGRIWMASDSGSCKKSDSMYLPSEIPGAASSVLPREGRASYGFLHPKYLEATLTTKKQWLDYLIEVHHVTIFPRLAKDDVVSYSAIQDELLHPDFKTLMAKRDSRTWLFVLREGWDEYKTFIDPPDTAVGYWGVTRRAHYAEVFKYIKVRCTGSAVLEELRLSYMPLDRLTKDYGSLAPFLDIPDPTNPKWIPLLTPFCVGMKDDVNFYLNCLIGAKKAKLNSDEKIRNIMHEIEDKIEESTETYSTSSLFRGIMNNSPLIYIPPEDRTTARPKSWVSHTECFWRGEPWITQTTGLENIYPDLERFFRTHLQVPNAGMDHLVKEAQALALQSNPKMSYIKKLFLAFASHIKNRGLDFGQLTKLKTTGMFPVSSTERGVKTEYLASIESTKAWFIADRDILRNQFAASAPLLMFDVAFIHKIRRFLEALDLKGRHLSTIATGVTEAHGDVEVHNGLTKKYRSRSKYLFRLIPENASNAHQLRSKFRTIDVYTASKIIQFWRAPLGLRLVQSTETEGSAFLESDYAADLRIYVKSGYENEVYPYELAQQLADFFNVQFQHRDLVVLAISAPEERVEEVFDSRGIRALEDEGAEVIEEDEETEMVRDRTLISPVSYTPGPSKKSRLRRSTDKRFTRLLSHTRFSKSFSEDFNANGMNGAVTNGVNGNASSMSLLPAYSVAVARATQNAIGRPVEPRQFTDAITLSALGGVVKDLDYRQESDAVMGREAIKLGFVDRVKAFLNIEGGGQDAGVEIVSDILASVLGSQYERKKTFVPPHQRIGHRATFNFTDTTGRFGAFLMRLDGLSGKAQGYTRLIYHLDVKTTDSDSFRMTQVELDRAREFSIHSQPDPTTSAPSKHVSVLVHISNYCKEPKIKFLADPWDLFEDGQLLLQSVKTYKATLRLRAREEVVKKAGNFGGCEVDGDADGDGLVGGGRRGDEEGPLAEGEGGFDAVMVRQEEDVVEEEEDEVPDYDEVEGKKGGNGKGKGKEKAVEMR